MANWSSLSTISCSRSSSRHLGGAGSIGPALVLFIYAAAFSFAYMRVGAGVGTLLLFGAVQVTIQLSKTPWRSRRRDGRLREFPNSHNHRDTNVSRAGYYAAVGRPPSAREVEDRRLAILIRESHERGRRFYGSPRVHLDLAKTHQVFVSRKRVIRIMRQEGLRARLRKRFKCTTMSNHDQPVAPSLLAREFRADRPNQQRWVGDTTELVTGDGKLYLAAIVDLFERFVVGWASPPSTTATDAQGARNGSPAARS